MTSIRTLAAHEVVRRAHPRPVTESDEVGMAAGKAIDTALSRFSHEFRGGLRPTAASMHRLGTEVLDEELADADLQLGAQPRERILAQIAGVLQAFRRSEIFGLARPRSRMILINETAGIYAQPDFWNGRDRFYEMKSYRASLEAPEIHLQLSLFSLAFPGVEGRLICFNRHSVPVETLVQTVPPVGDPEKRSVLGLALGYALEDGVPKVLEYIDSPLVRYSIPAPSSPS